MKSTFYNSVDKFPDHIEEYVSKSGVSKDNHASDLFNSDDENIDFKSDFSFEELVLLNKIMFNNSFLSSKGLGSPYDAYLQHWKRLKVSLDRKSRGEFVDVNRKERFEQNLRRFSDFANISKVKD